MMIIITSIIIFIVDVIIMQIIIVITITFIIVIIISSVIMILLSLLLLLYFSSIPQTPLHLACIMKDSDVIRLLVEASSNPNEADRNGQTAAHHTCKSSTPSCLGAILRYSQVEVNLNIRNYEGRSSLLTDLKASFNNFKSEIHGPTCYQCL